MAQEIPDFNAMATSLINALPPNVSEMAKGFFKGSFIKEGFTDYAFIAWPKRKDTDTHKVLTRSQALRDSVVVKSATPQRIEIAAGEGLPYAAIHNTGGTITVRVTDKARKFFWYMYKQSKNEKWKWMALTKKESFTLKIPQRQYIGESQELLKRIDNYINQQIITTFTTHS